MIVDLSKSAQVLFVNAFNFHTQIKWAGKPRPNKFTNA